VNSKESQAKHEKTGKETKKTDTKIMRKIVKKSQQFLNNIASQKLLKSNIVRGVIGCSGG